MESTPEAPEHRRLHLELEQAMATINRERISAVTGVIRKENFINAAKMVACLRANYLKTVLQLGDQCHSECIPPNQHSNSNACVKPIARRSKALPRSSTHCVAATSPCLNSALDRQIERSWSSGSEYEPHGKAPTLDANKPAIVGGLMDWRARLGSKLVSLENAMAHVQSGHVVNVAPYSCTPMTLCEALKAHALARGLRDIRIEHSAAFVSWTEPQFKGVFRLFDNYATPPNRAAAHSADMDYLPIGLFRGHELPPGVTSHPDIFLVPVSPPDAKGFCSFGSGVWMSKTVVRQAKYVIAEIQENFIRTGGENFVHVDQIDLFVEGRVPAGGPAAPGPSDEEISQVETICTLVAAELVNDGDTLQMGVGTVSASLGHFLDFRNDLGVQTELITGGIADLVARGVITGNRKSIHRGKVVGSAITAMPREELLMIHDNPVFELYDFGYTDDLRRLIQLDPFVTVNNALIVDLTGQVAAESFDHRPYTGVGGQTVFMIAGAYSPNGKSVSVLPSSSLPSGGGPRVTRIVPALPPGTPVTVPRTYVDFVVTEFGIAELRGRSVPQRVRALCEIAHPDFRDMLRDEARRLYGVQ